MSVDVKNACKQYFNGLEQLKDSSLSREEKGIACLKVASYFLTAGLLPLVFLIVQEINNSLLEREITPIDVKNETKEPLGNKKTAKTAHEVAADHLPKMEEPNEKDRYSALIGENQKKIEGPLVLVPAYKAGQFSEKLHQKISVDDPKHWRTLKPEERKAFGFPEYVDKYPSHLRDSKIPYGPFTSFEEFNHFFWEMGADGERVHSLRTGYFDIDDSAFQNFALDLLSKEKLFKGKSSDEIFHLLAKPDRCARLFGILDCKNKAETLPLTMLIRARNNAISSRPDVHPDGRFFTDEEKVNGVMKAFYEEKKKGWDSLEIFSWFDWETGYLRSEVDLNGLLENVQKENDAPLQVSVVQQTTQEALEAIARAHPDKTDEICWLNLANAHMDGGILKGPSRPDDTNHGSQEENTVSDCSAAVIQASVSDIVNDGGSDHGRARYQQGFHIPPGGNFFLQTSFVTGDRVKCNSIACAFADFRSEPRYTGISEFKDYSIDGVHLRSDDKYKKRIFMDIYGVLATAKVKNQRYLVLGGSGCGAFGHHRELEAEMWKNVLALPEFRGCFSKVDFAITGYSLAKTFNDVFNPT